MPPDPTTANPTAFDSVTEKALEILARKKAKPSAEPPAAPAPHPFGSWPRPLDETAFYGLAGDIVRAIEPHTEADPVALLAQFLLGFGNVIGRGAWFTVEATPHYMNLFAVLVGSTSKGRKGTSWGHIRRLLQGVDGDWTAHCIKEGLSSGEGLIWAVRDPIEKQEPIKQKGRTTGYETVTADAGIEDKRLLIAEGEFASALRVLGRDGNILSAILRNAWDTGDLRILTKNSPAQATGAHISVLGHITKSELVRHLDGTEAGNGFANRFLWLCTRRSKELPEGGRIHEVDFAPLLKRLNEAVQFARSAGELRRDEECRAIWAEVYGPLTEGRPGLFGAVTARAEAQVLRLSCVYALLDQSDVVKVQHLGAAWALWFYARESAAYIFGDALGDPAADKILAELRDHPDGLSRTNISAIFSGNREARQIERALATLEENRLAFKNAILTSGRAAEVWYPQWTIETKEGDGAEDSPTLPSSISSPLPSAKGVARG